MLNILILSGGTGSIALTQGLKEYSQNINITTKEKLLWNNPKLNQ